MHTLSGFAQVSTVVKNSGSLNVIKLETPEGLIFDAKYWSDGDDGVLHKAEDGEIYSFSAHVSDISGSWLTLTTFIKVDMSKCAASPPTISNVMGTITGPSTVGDDFFLSYDIFDKKTSSTVSGIHKVLLRGSHWGNRKAVLRVGTIVQIIGTIESISTTDADNFWIFKGVSSSSTPSPKKERKAFSPLLKRKVPLHDPTTAHPTLVEVEEERSLPKLAKAKKH